MITQEEIFKNPVRALSFKHPYAELMKHGKQETRTWATSYTGLVLICSSVNPYGDRELIEIAGPEQYARILKLLGVKWYNNVKRGSAIGVARIVGSYGAGLWSKQPEKFELHTFVKFNPDLHVHEYRDFTPIDPFPWRGSLGFRTLGAEDKQKIKILKP